MNKTITTAPDVTDTGVVINGVTWATRNVDEAGTFAATPESPGKFYQWNRRNAWAATGGVSGGDNSTPTGTTWESNNDPSPEGWRVPTLEEIKSLLDSEKVCRKWIISQEVFGCKFTDIASGNTLFLPAAGFPFNKDVPLSNKEGIFQLCKKGGNYWSSTQCHSDYAYYLLIFSAEASYPFVNCFYAYTRYYNRSNWRSVRSVRVSE